jgi:hypothetical protein
MKRLFATSLAFVLVMSTLGNAFASACCPGGRGRDCCLKKSFTHTHHSTAELPATQRLSERRMMVHCSHSEPEQHTKAVTPMRMEGREGATAVPANHAAEPAPRNESEPAAEAKFDQPLQSCSHCFSHSGLSGFPIASAAAGEPGSKETSFAPIPVARILFDALGTFGNRNVLSDHAPPGSRLPRFLLIHVLLI